MCQTKQYLDETSPDAFKDFPYRNIPVGTKVCDRCKGFGGWNLRLNAYPLHSRKNTPINRHLYSHFRASCNSCWGHGYITPDQECPKPVQYIGHVYGDGWKCKQCGKKTSVDSSD